MLEIESPPKNVLGWLPGWEPTHLLGWNLHAERNLLSWKSQPIYLSLLLGGKNTRDFKGQSIRWNLNLWSPFQRPDSTMDYTLQWLFLPYFWIWMEICFDSHYSVTLPSDAARQAENRIKQASILLRNWWHRGLGAWVWTKGLVVSSSSAQLSLFNVQGCIWSFRADDQIQPC